MAYTALYRKYRPTNFSSIVGQDVIVDILKNSIINNKVSHAYLFTGPRGTGKTSTARFWLMLLIVLILLMIFVVNVLFVNLWI